MNIKLTEIWKRISNWKSLMGLVSAGLIITDALELPVDNEVVLAVATGFLTWLVILGIINKEGMETTKWNK